MAVALAASGCAGTQPPSPGGGASSTTAAANAPVAGRPLPAPAFVLAPPVARADGARGPGLVALEEELKRGMKELGEQDPRPYFIAYEVHDRVDHEAAARNGVLLNANTWRSRVMDVDVRAGDYKFDSTHPLPSRGFDMGMFSVSSVALPVDDDAAAMKAIAWRETDRLYKTAAERFLQLRTRRNVDVALEDKSDDFSREKPVVHIEPPAKLEVDRATWEKRVRELSARFTRWPEALESGAFFRAGVHTRWVITSEGTVVQTSQPALRVGMFVSARADDGQDLRRYENFDAASFEALPPLEVMVATADRLLGELRALKAAAPAEPFSGPAILEGRAAGVFFHEIFGHRVEGHRQKDDTQGQTFAKKIGEPVMPSFISVFDDPTIARLGNVDLNGFYRFDDEGVPAQRATLVDGGIMKGFLLGRTPTRGFTRSNGHGRRQEGRRVVPRQANLVVQPSTVVSREQLVERLRAEARRQGRSYGLRFTDIEGGFTTTGRGGPQAFKVLPLMVYKVFVDGKPDELIRGADLVGTPLTSLTKILAASDEWGIFNGYCGAESGSVPVSGVAPGLLIEQLEIERKSKGQDKAPVLPPPPLSASAGAEVRR
jgi:TldD protein